VEGVLDDLLGVGVDFRAPGGRRNDSGLSGVGDFPGGRSAIRCVPGEEEAVALADGVVSQAGTRGRAVGRGDAGAVGGEGEAMEGAYQVLALHGAARPEM